MFRPGSSGLYEAGQPHVVVAVDLGFSKSKKSCGLAIRHGTELWAVEVAFGPCVKRVAKELGGATNPVLIIEAPLSGFFGATGNPSHRDEIEIEIDANGKKQHRGWYYGAGAAICLGAITFLRSLGDELGAQPLPPTVTVYEGFLSFKSEATSHSDDASTLRQAFDEGHILELKVPDRVTVLSVLNLIDDASSGLPPAIVQVPRK